MARRFEGQRVLITGASAGIGRATALEFVARGATVLALARSAERLEALAQACGSERVRVFVADVADAPAMEAAARLVLEGGGPPDVIVANAGVGLDALFVETTEALARQVLEVNVFGVWRTLWPFLPGMIERGRGRIVLVSSVVGKRGIPYYSIYSASKFALHGFAEALRVELRGTGVTVGVLCPGSTRTEFDERKLRRGPSQPRRRIAEHTPESVARAIVRLADSRRRECVLTPEGKLLAWTNRFFPGLLDWLLARVLVQRGKP